MFLKRRNKEGIQHPIEKEPISKMDEQLVAQHRSEPICISPGIYIIGESIPAGVYSMKYLGNGDDATSKCRTNYSVYENQSIQAYAQEIDQSMPMLHGFIDSVYETIVPLYDGNCLELSQGGASLYYLREAHAPQIEYAPPSGAELPRGEYKIGPDMPEGLYSFYFNGKTRARLRVFRDPQRASSRWMPDYASVLDAQNPITALSLEEGMIFFVDFSSVITKKCSPISIK